MTATAEVHEAEPIPREPEVLPSIAEPATIGIAAPTTFAECMELGVQLLDTGFLPASIKTPAQFTAVVLTGQELGLPLMQSTRLLVPIPQKGGAENAMQITLKPEGMLALWGARYGGRHQWLHSDDEKAVLRLINKSGDEHIETFTAKQAKALGLINTKPNFEWSNWAKQLATMLRWRCTSAAFRFFAPYVNGGLRIEDEVEHWQPVSARLRMAWTRWKRQNTVSVIRPRSAKGPPLRG